MKGFLALLILALGPLSLHGAVRIVGESVHTGMASPKPVLQFELHASGCVYSLKILTTNQVRSELFFDGQTLHAIVWGAKGSSATPSGPVGYQNSAFLYDHPFPVGNAHFQGIYWALLPRCYLALKPPRPSLEAAARMRTTETYERAEKASRFPEAGGVLRLFRSESRMPTEVLTILQTTNINGILMTTHAKREVFYGAKRRATSTNVFDIQVKQIVITDEEPRLPPLDGLTTVTDARFGTNGQAIAYLAERWESLEELRAKPEIQAQSPNPPLRVFSPPPLPSKPFLLRYAPHLMIGAAVLLLAMGLAGGRKR